jgi:hypothetical protein
MGKEIVAMAGSLYAGNPFICLSLTQSTR